MPDVSVIIDRQPYRALVVDDDAQICAVLVALLSQAGWTVLTAGTAAEAGRVLADRTHVLDLAVIDLKLPDGDGMDLVPQALARREPPDVVLVTGYPSDQAYLQAIRLGVLDFLIKPFTPSDVGAMLRARTVRERQRLGMIVDRFERIDLELARVREDMHDVRAILHAWETAHAAPPRTSGATGA